MTSFVERLREGRPLLGLWQALANGYTAEICASAGFDWLLIDGEHAPNDAQTLLAQLQALAPFPLEPIGRPPATDPATIKQYLDLGFHTLLCPMVDSAEQARAIVTTTRFPPAGIRGVASSTSRASRFGMVPDFLTRAHERLCVIAQIESAAALAEVDAIAATEGIDALFIGPGDLAASLGHAGNPTHPDVQRAIDQAFDAIAASGKPAGIFALSTTDAARRIAQGFAFASIGSDIGLLLSGARSQLSQVRDAMDQHRQNAS